MNKLERLHRMEMARDFAVQAENALIALSEPRTVDERKALRTLGTSINLLGAVIDSARIQLKDEKGIRTL